MCVCVCVCVCVRVRVCVCTCVCYSAKLTLARPPAKGKIVERANSVSIGITMEVIGVNNPNH